MNILIRFCLGCCFLFATHSDILATCSPIGFPTPTTDCSSAPVVCLIDGFCSSTPSDEISPIPFCANNVLNNPSWFSFIGTSNSFVMDVSISNCTGTVGSTTYGVQVALYSGCPFSSGNQIICNSACRSGTPTDYVIRVSQAIMPNRQYWMVIDGCNGDVCDYTIDIISGIGSPNINIIPGQNVSVPDTVCPGQTFNASYPTVTHATEYQWTFNGTAATSFDSSIAHTVPFNQPDGPYDVCLIKAKNPCDEKDINVCKSVYIKSILPIERFDTICYGTNVTIGNQTFSQSGDYSVMLRSPRGCDSIINLHLNVIRIPDTDIDDFPVCKTNLPYRSPINGLNYPQGLDYKITLKTKDKWRCDSVIIFDVISVESKANLTTSGSLDCNNNLSRVILDSQTSESIFLPFDQNSSQTPDSIHIEWLKNGIFYSKKDTLELAIRDTGTYILKYTVFYKGTICEDTALYRLRFTAPLLIQPILVGNSNACLGNELTLSFNNLDPSASSVNWTVPTPLVKVGPSNSNTIRINSSGPGNSIVVCAQQYNVCSTSNPGCIDVTIAEAPNISIVRDTNICQSGTARIFFQLISGSLPAIVQFANNTTMLVTQPNQSFTISPLIDTVITVIRSIHPNGLCQTNIPSSVRVGVLPNATAVLNKNIEVCNKVDPSGIRPFILDLDALIISGSLTGTWTNYDMVLATGGRNNQNFTGIAPGVYRYTYRLVGVPPCPDFVDTVYIQVSDCNCPSVALANNDVICTSNNTVIINLNLYRITNENGMWSITTNLITPLSIRNDSLLDIPAGAIGGGMRFSYTLSTPPIPGCLASNSFNITINNPPILNLNRAPSQCNFDPLNGNATVFNLNSLLVAGSSTGQWTLNGINVANPTTYDFNGFIPGKYVFEYTTNTAQNPCQNMIDTVEIDVIDCTCKTIVTSAPSALCNSNGLMDLTTLQANVPGPGVWSILSNVVPPANIAGTLLSVVGSGAGNILLQFRLNSVRAGCRDTSLQSLTVINQPNATVTSSITVCDRIPPGGSGLPSNILNFGSLVLGNSSGTWSAITGAQTTGTFSTSLDFSGSTVGNYVYQYQLLANAPCIDKAYNLSVNVKNCSCPIFSGNNLAPLCNSNNTNIPLTGLITSAPRTFTFSILSNVTPPIILTGSNINVLNSGSGNFSILVKLDSSIVGCKDTIVLNGNIVAQPSATITPNITVCNQVPPVGSGLPSNILNFGSLVLGNTSGTWSAITGAQTTGTFSTNLDFSGSVAGNYIYQYQLLANAPCIDKAYNLSVNVKNCICPIFSGNNLAPLCNSNNTNIPLTGLITFAPRTFTFSILSNVTPPITLTGSNINVLNSGSGNFSILVKLDSSIVGCKDTIVLNGNIVAQPSATITPNITVCNQVPPVGSGLPSNILNLNSLITAGITSGTWAKISPATAINGTFPNALDFTSQIPGTNFVFGYNITASNPCSAFNSSIQINVRDCQCPSIGTLPPSKILCNDNDTIDLNQLLVLGTAPGAWTISQNLNPPATINGAIFNATNAGTGIYRVLYKLTNTFTGCLDTSSQAISVEKQRKAGIASAIMRACFGTPISLVLTNELSGADLGGVWSEISSIPSVGGFNGTIFNATGQIPGLYTFKYLLTKGAACTGDSAFVSFKVDSIPTINLGSDLTIRCDQNGINFNNIGSNALSFIWRNITSNTTISSGQTYSININESGLYSVSVKNDSSKCGSTDSIQILKAKMESLMLSSTSILCNNDCNGSIAVSQSISNGIPIIPKTSLNGRAFSDSLAFKNLCPGVYNIVAKDANNCSLSETITLENPPLVTVDLGNSRTIISGESVEIIAQYSVPNGQLKMTILRAGGSSIICDLAPCTNTRVMPTVTTTYIMEITDLNGCTAQDTVIIYVNPRKNTFVPNVFSPNGDGINDLFKPFSDDNVKSIKSFRVFNRWGDMMFERQNVNLLNTDEAGWDGTYQGKFVQSDVYVYHIVLEFKDGNSVNLYGDVTVTY